MKPEKDCGMITFALIRMNTFVRFIRRQTIQKSNLIKRGQKVSVKQVGGKWEKPVIESLLPRIRQTLTQLKLRPGLTGQRHYFVVSGLQSGEP